MDSGEACARVGTGARAKARGEVRAGAGAAQFASELDSELETELELARKGPQSEREIEQS